MTTYETYVLTVYQQGNITKAAKELDITQPSISAGLNAIEKKYGFAIFNRRTNPVETTKEGQIYIDYLIAKNKLDCNFEKYIDRLFNNNDVEIRIGAPAAYISGYILPTITGFLDSHEKCRIKILESNVQGLSKMAKSGDVDFFISTSKDISNELNYEFIGEEKVYLCVPSTYEINKQMSYVEGRLVIPDTLWKERFISLGKNQPLQNQVDTFLSKNNVSYFPTIEVDQVTSAVQLAAEGCGICFATDCLLSNFERTSNLNLYSLSETDFSRNIYLAYMDITYMTDIHKDFIEEIKKRGGKTNEIS